MEAGSVDAIISGYEALVGDGGVACVARDVLAVTGADAARYLQGQLSQDVVALAGDDAWSFLLAPSGKVVAWLRVHRVGPDEYLLEVDPSWGEIVRSRLQRFLLRTDAVISEPRRCALVAERWRHSLVRLGDDGEEGALVSTPIGPGVAGRDVLMHDRSIDEVTPSIERLVPEDSFERYRIAHGVVQMGTELTDETIPGEAGQWVIDASVSFTKGCYTGQELVARIDSRGNNVPHPIRLLVLGADAAAGDQVWLDGADVGIITSVAPALRSDLPALALARVGRSVVPGSIVAVGGASAPAPATVVEPGSVH